MKVCSWFAADPSLSVKRCTLLVGSSYAICKLASPFGARECFLVSHYDSNTPHSNSVFLCFTRKLIQCCFLDGGKWRNAKSNKTKQLKPPTKVVCIRDVYTAEQYCTIARSMKVWIRCICTPPPTCVVLAPPCPSFRKAFASPGGSRGDYENIRFETEYNAHDAWNS